MCTSSNNSSNATINNNYNAVNKYYNICYLCIHSSLSRRIQVTYEQSHKNVVAYSFSLQLFMLETPFTSTLTI